MYSVSKVIAVSHQPATQYNNATVATAKAKLLMLADPAPLAACQTQQALFCWVSSVATMAIRVKVSDNKIKAHQDYPL